MVDFLLEFSKSKGFKKTIELRRGLGPLEEPQDHQRELATGLDSILAACGHVESFVTRNGFLPSTVMIGDSEAGIESFYHVLAETMTILAGGEAEPKQVRNIGSFDPVGDKIFQEITGDMKSWTIHKKDLNPENILRHLRLQLWTLKPAVLRG
jgi:hypothetical protein